MKEPWIVFYCQGKEVCTITVRGTFPGEIGATMELLAAENNCRAEEITVKIAVR